MKRAAFAVLLLAPLAALAVVVVHDFSRYVNYYPYLAVDDGLANVSYALASHGRYGFLSSPVQGYTSIARHHGFFNYGPWYFYAGAALIWLFGYSLALMRGMHLAGILLIVAVGVSWFGGRRQLAAGVGFGAALLTCFDVLQWPMARPDIAVSVFAALFIVAAGRAIETGSRKWWCLAGLASGCAAWSHLIAWAVVPACAIVLGVTLAGARAGRREWLASSMAAAAGMVIATLMFYGSFGFRVRDHLQSMLAYRTSMKEANALSVAYFDVLRGHLTFAGVPRGPAAVGAAAAVIALGLIAASFWRPAEVRRRTLALALPPLTVLICYGASLGLYPNYHAGYTVLTQVAALWTAAAATAILLEWLRSRSDRAGALMSALISVAIVVATVGRVRAAESSERLQAIRELVSIPDYVHEVLATVPNGARSFGTIMFGIETPDRVDLLQFDEGFNALRRAPAAMRSALAPDYLLWSYPENRDNAMQLLEGGPNLFEDFSRLTEPTLYDLTSLVVAPPYGVTRVFARRAAGRITEPAISAFDAGGGRWLGAPAEWRTLPTGPSAAPLTLELSRGRSPRIAAATRTLEATLDAGWYVIRAQIRPGSGPVRGRLLLASPSLHPTEAIGDLGPTVDIAPYAPNTSETFVVYRHDGGPFYVGQFDGGDGAAMIGLQIRQLLGSPNLSDARLAASAVPLQAFVPSTRDVVISRLADGSYDVEGNDSREGYQVISARLPVQPRRRVRLAVSYRVTQGEVCLGVLTGDAARWLIAPQKNTRELLFDTGTQQGVYVVLANCTTAPGPRSRFVIGNATFAQTQDPPFADLLMDGAAPSRQAR